MNTLEDFTGVPAEAEFKKDEIRTVAQRAVVDLFMIGILYIRGVMRRDSPRSTFNPNT